MSHLSVNCSSLCFFTAACLTATHSSRQGSGGHTFLGHCFYWADTGPCVCDWAGCWHWVLLSTTLAAWPVPPPPPLQSSCSSLMVPSVTRGGGAGTPPRPPPPRPAAAAAALRRQGGGVFLHPWPTLLASPPGPRPGDSSHCSFLRGLLFLPFPNLCLLLLHYIQSLMNSAQKQNG